MLCEQFNNTYSVQDFKVLILVLMEDALREEVKISEVTGDEGVLILVLMEDALRGLLSQLCHF